MNSSCYKRRFYRDWISAKDLYHCRILDRESDLQISANKKINQDYIIERLKSYRWDIEHYITRDRKFLTSLEPISVELTAPAIIKAMAEAAKRADVGPMAGVAGAIAGFLGRDLLKLGYKDLIIENGGDIFMKSTKQRVVGIYAGKSAFSKKISIKIHPLDTPIGICASSGTVGHSMSFGCADCAVILQTQLSPSRLDYF